MLSLLSFLSFTYPLTTGTTPETQAAVTANNQFAVDLYRRLAKEDGNLFFSPYCINKTLSMVYAGARGETEKEMAAVLHVTLGQERQHKAFLAMRNILNRGSSIGLVSPFTKRGEVELYSAANLWGRRGAGFDKRYLSLLQDCYGAGLQEVDFSDSEGARKTINAWVEKQTRNKITELFQPGTLNADTRLVLASAIYFKGDWSDPFKKSDTRDDDFWVTSSTKTTAPLMSQTAEFDYFEDGDCQGLRMLYAGKKHAMVILLPHKRDGLADLQKTLSAKRLADCMDSFREQKVRVWLPRFKMKSTFALKDTLAALGMAKAFGPAADFSGMNAGREPLSISTVTHKAFVDVNETGTEAAAATGIGMTFGAAPGAATPRIPVFRADHPFVFAICDTQTGLVLFLGRVERP